jgi:hypothetical protein
MTPNLGAGGNAAIESAAALSNALFRLLAESKSSPSLDQIRSALLSFQAKRSARANVICTQANDLTRVEALASLPHKLMALYAIPALGDFLSDFTCDGMVGAELLESLPAPSQSLHATMPWNPEVGVGKHENKLARAAYALPLLFVAYGCWKTMGAEMGKAMLGQAAETRFFGIRAIDSVLSQAVAAFTPFLDGKDVASRMQMFSFLADIVPIQAIWLIESIRRGNFTTAAHLL